MRAVLRAALAARRSDRPTAMENFDGLDFLPFLFIIVAPTYAAYHRSYHTPSTHQLKDNKSFESSPNSVKNDAARPPAAQRARPA